MNQVDAAILSAVFAVSNMGFPVPSSDVIKRAYSWNKVTPAIAVSSFAEQYIESDEHLDIFVDEARMWNGMLLTMTEDNLKATYVDIYSAWKESREVAV